MVKNVRFSSVDGEINPILKIFLRSLCPYIDKSVIALKSIAVEIPLDLLLAYFLFKLLNSCENTCVNLCEFQVHYPTS